MQRIALIGLLCLAGCDSAPAETDFRAFNAQQASLRADSFTICAAVMRADDNSETRKRTVACMERLGYSYAPR